MLRKTASLTARLTGGSENPVPGVTISFVLDNGDGTVGVPASVTDAQGIARSVYTASLTPGTETVRADAEGTGLTAFADIVEPAFEPAEIALTATPSEVLADGISRSKPDATVRDGVGNTLA